MPTAKHPPMIDEPDVSYAGATLKATRYSAQNGARIDDGIIDEVAIARRLTGDVTVNLSVRERVAGIAQLARRGYDDVTIAERLGLSFHAVLQTRKRHRIPGRPIGTNQWTKAVA